MVLGHIQSVAALRGGHHPIIYYTLASVLLYSALFILRRLVNSLALRRAYKRHGCSPPPAYPHRDPVFGLDFALDSMAALREGRFLESQAARHARCGTTYYTWIMGRQAVHTTDPENVKAILAASFKDYMIGGRRAILGPLLGRGIFVSDGDDWAHSRALLRPNFIRDQLADLAMLERHVQELLRVLPASPAVVVDLQECFLRFTMDSSTEFLFGHSTHALAETTARDEQFAAAFKLALSDMSRQIRSGPLNRFRRRDPAVPRAYKTCRDYVGTFVDEAVAIRERAAAGELDNDDEKDVGHRYYFLRELAKAIDDRERICDELLNILVAGRDTTASLISSAFHVLSRRPDLWRKLRNEVELLGGRLPSYEELRGLKFAKYMINETLRLYPPVANNGRRAIRDTILPTGGGPDGTSPVFVPKGTPVVYSPWAMHRRTDFFGPDALEFRPERWETQRHGWEYLPFNGGPRICLGQQYALTEAMYVMVRMAQEFESVESVDGGPWKEDVALTIAIDGGVNCRLTRA